MTHKMWTQAEERVLEIIADDDQWNLFVQQVGQDGMIELDGKDRERGKTSKDYRALLKSMYINFSARQICDVCEYNSNWRRGQRKFSKRRRFDCNWRKTQGDVFAEQTAQQEGKGGSLYKFGNLKWKAKYNRLSKTILEEHKDRTKAPVWLDVEKNLCPHYYLDLSKP